MRNLSLEEFTEEASKRGVKVIKPGNGSTMEVRIDNSRFFPEVDDTGIVTGGKFG